MADGPLVTVIVNCYNHARWLDECLESVRAQTLQNTQLIVMDDASTDGSDDLIRDWIARTKMPCRFVANRTNMGLAATRNMGFRLAEGELVSWVSTDDVWLPNKLEVQLAEMQRGGTEVGVVYGDAHRIDTEGKLIGDTLMSTVLPERTPPEGDLFDQLIRDNFIPSMATLVRRRCLEEIGGYDPAVYVEDWDLWLRLARVTRFRFSSEIVVRYRVVPGSRIHTKSLYDALETAFLVSRKHLGYRPVWDRFLYHRMANAAVELALRGHLVGIRYMRATVGPPRPFEGLLALLQMSVRVPVRLARRFGGAALKRTRARVRAWHEARSAS